MKLTFSLEETIPFYNSDWTVMQMVNFKFWVSWTQEEWETAEQTKERVREEFEKQREYVLSLVPSIKRKEQKINYIIEQFKKINPELTNKLIKEANNIIT
jgi:Tfp pilus assembly protein PilO